MSHPTLTGPPPRLRRASGVVVEELDGRLLLLAPGQTHVLALDEVASAVWQLIGSGPTGDELAVALAQRYEVSIGRVAADVAPALEVLRRHGLLV